MWNKIEELFQSSEEIKFSLKIAFWDVKKYIPDVDVITFSIDI